MIIVVTLCVCVLVLIALSSLWILPRISCNRNGFYIYFGKRERKWNGVFDLAYIRSPHSYKVIKDQLRHPNKSVAGGCIDTVSLPWWIWDMIFHSLPLDLGHCIYPENGPLADVEHLIYKSGTSKDDLLFEGLTTGDRAILRSEIRDRIKAGVLCLECLGEGTEPDADTPCSKCESTGVVRLENGTYGTYGA